MRRFCQFRQAFLQNAPRQRLLSALTLLIYPLFLFLIVENTHLQNLQELCSFVLRNFGVFLYDLLFLAIIQLGLLLVVKRGWIAMLLEAFLFYTLSLVEYFKFDANGTHFSIPDLVMAGKVSDVARFAKIEVNAVMVVNLLLLTAFIGWTAFLGVRVRLSLMKSLPLGAGCLVLLGVAITVPKIYTAVYDAFGVHRVTSDSPYGVDETFNENLQIAYLSQDLSAQASQTMTRPDNYSEDKMDDLLWQEPLPAAKGFEAPDVVVIMSEAYTDFRSFDGLEVPPEVYQNYDRLSLEGHRGQALVPTFGGYTCKTEFELLFGLPMKGILNEEIPHRMFLKGEERPTFAAAFREKGYGTAFIHPFSSSFYNREQAYQSYGFDQLYFEENLTVEQTRLDQYIDDHTLVRQIASVLDGNADKPSFIFAVSMQNHGPYAADAGYRLEDSRLSEEEQGELGRYLHGIAQTDQALAELTDYLKGRERPAVLLFIGDHYPYLGSQGMLYKKLTDISDEYRLYEQDYLLWSSEPHEYAFPQERVSAFYLPHILADYIGFPMDRYLAEMQAIRETTPLFSFGIGEDSPDAEKLMQLAYDRTVGDGYTADAAA